MSYTVTAFFLLGLTFSLSAKDYGIHGQTFPIAEEDLIDYIQKRMKCTDDQIIREHYVRSFQNPQAVSELSKAKIEKIHYFDPTVISKADIKDKYGKIIIQKGASYNPLDYFALSQELLFLDGDQESHIQWAKSCEKEAKWVLVKGKPFELEERENRPVFFDQSGVLVKKLSIQDIPARVSQEGKRLKIESIITKEAICGNS
jgi:conjugal transfer pilus assembly protein TraW